MNDHECWCDNCGRKLADGGRESYPIHSLPCDIASANKGEAAYLCPVCYHSMLRKCPDFKPNSDPDSSIKYGDLL